MVPGGARPVLGTSQTVPGASMLPVRVGLFPDKFRFCHVLGVLGVVAWPLRVSEIAGLAPRTRVLSCLASQLSFSVRIAE
jgi:hypothetical protein